MPEIIPAKPAELNGTMFRLPPERFATLPAGADGLEVQPNVKTRAHWQSGIGRIVGAVLAPDAIALEMAAAKVFQRRTIAKPGKRQEQALGKR